jgi:hypothetical protein
MVPIPYGLTFRTTVTGRVPKAVHCEECGLDYVYLLEATEEGRGTSFLFTDNEGAQERSESGAAALLAVSLGHGCAVVPCPGCGRVQQHMIPEARRLRHRWMFKAAAATFAVCGILFLGTMLLGMGNMYGNRIDPGLATTLWAAVGLLGLIALGLPVLKHFLSRRYDPNQAPVEVRMRMGQDFAITADELRYAEQEGTPGDTRKEDGAAPRP